MSDYSNIIGELRMRGDRMSHRAADAMEDVLSQLKNVNHLYDLACKDIQEYTLIIEEIIKSKE